MEELNGIDTLREIRKRGCQTPVVVLTQYDEQGLLLHLQEFGISGFLHKNSDPAELAAAIRMAVAGGVFYNSFFAELPVSGLCALLAQFTSLSQYLQVRGSS